MADVEAAKNAAQAILNVLPSIEGVKALCDVIQNGEQVARELADANGKAKADLASLNDECGHARGLIDDAKQRAVELVDKANAEAARLRQEAMQRDEARVAEAQSQLAAVASTHAKLTSEHTTLSGEILAMKAEIDELVKKKAAIASAIASVTSQAAE